jgi:hypothetical protein
LAALLALVDIFFPCGFIAGLNGVAGVDGFVNDLADTDDLGILMGGITI